MAAKFFNEIFPEFKERALSLQKEKLELVAHLARMRLTGPQTRDDFILLYMLASGQITVPEKVADIFGSTAASQGSAEDRYIYGLFNPRRYNPYADNMDSKNNNLANIGIPGVDVALPSGTPGAWTATGFGGGAGWATTGQPNAANKLLFNQFVRAPQPTDTQTATTVMGFPNWLQAQEKGYNANTWANLKPAQTGGSGGIAAWQAFKS